MVRISNDKLIPVYVDEVDQMLDRLSSKIPRTSLELIYLNEIDLQKKIYTVIMVIATLAIIFVMLA